MATLNLAEACVIFSIFSVVLSQAFATNPIVTNKAPNAETTAKTGFILITTLRACWATDNIPLALARA